MHEKFTARFATTPQDILAAQALRADVFRGGAPDVDAFDQLCEHVLVEDGGGRLVCTFRLMLLGDGRELARSYAAQFYDLSALLTISKPMLEMGRFSIDATYETTDILRVAWRALACFVEDNDVELLFGCSSFSGTTAADYAGVFVQLHDRHLAPEGLAPKVKSSQVCHFEGLRVPVNHAQSPMPPLLRSYLAMGGWVSDHAVVDHDLNTLHVFTGLEVKKVSPARRRFILGEMRPNVEKTAFG